MSEESKQEIEEKKEPSISSNHIPRFFSPYAKFYPFSTVNPAGKFTELYAEDCKIFGNIKKEIKKLAEYSQNYFSEYDQRYSLHAILFPTLPRIEKTAYLVNCLAKKLHEALFAEDIFGVNCANIISTIKFYKESVLKPEIEVMFTDPAIGPEIHEISKKVMSSLSEIEKSASHQIHLILDKISPETTYNVALDAPIKVPDVKTAIHFKP